MDRRQFIKWSSFLTVSAAGSTLLAACGGDDDDDQAASGGDSGRSVFSLGVASGDPRPDSVVLWTRVDGGDGTAALAVKVQVATDKDFKSMVLDTGLSADPAWDYTIRHKVTGLAAGTVYYYRFLSGSAASAVGRTWTAPAAGAPVAQLKFAFVSCQDWSVNHWGAYADMMNEDLDFIVHLGDYVYEELGSPAPTAPAVDALHPPIELPDGTRNDDGSVYATTTADYRALYRAYRSDPRIQAVHANWPVIAIWDDHEFSDDAWQDHETYTDANAGQLPRRRSANQAWYEYTPADVSFAPDEPSFENIEIYRSFVFGDLATLVMTDERLYRADHVIPETAAGGRIGSRYLVSAATLAATEATKMGAAGGALTPVSMLGDTQRGWWQDQMRSAATTWKLWGNEVSLLRMQVDGFEAVVDLLTAAVESADASLADAGPTLRPLIEQDLRDARADNLTPAPFARLAAFGANACFSADDVAMVVARLNAALPPYALMTTFLLDADQWDGYNAERKAMMSFLQSNGIQNVVALTGDIHAFFAGPVMDDYDAATPQPVMVDLVTAGISSSSLFRFYSDFLASTPAFASLTPLVHQGSSNTLNGTIKHHNGWIRYADTDAQGYAVVQLTPAQLTCTFKRVKQFLGGDAPSPAVESTQAMVVAAGAADVVLQ